MKLKPICDWGMHNWCLTPGLVFGKGSRCCWLYVFFLRGRLGLSFRGDL